MDPETTYTVSPGWALIMRDAGINPANVLRRAGLPRDLFTQPRVGLTPMQYYALWAALSEETQDPLLPLTIGQAISIESFDAPIFAATCSRDLNAAATRIAKYKKLIGPMRLLIARSATETELEMFYPQGVKPARAFTNMELVFWVALPRLATRAPLRPVRVTTPYPPEDADAYIEYFGVRVRKSDRYTVAYSAEDAARPFLTANEAMWGFFEPELRRRLSELEEGTAVAERVRAALLELLPSGEGSMEAVAHELAFSSRTLQRRLKGEGTTFQAVLSNTRESLARHYLANSAMSAGEISFLLGYEDPHSFYRAFNAWTGQTPERVRLATGFAI